MKRKYLAGAIALALSIFTLFTFESSASAIAPDTGYASYTAAVPNGADGTVSMTAGFGNIAYSSSGSSGITIPGGSSAIQPLSTPFAAFIGLSSTGQQYINTRLNNGATATNTYRFLQNTPNNGKWAFSLGDVDAERLTITATKANGSAATAAEIGFQAQYNYNDPTDSVAHLTITQSGNSVVAEDPSCPTTCDTVGISVWFKPTVSLSYISISALGKSGFPVYQTWFATQYKPVSGHVDPFQGTPVVNPTPIPPLSLDLIDLNGPGNSDDVVVATTTSDTSGNYSFPSVYPEGTGVYEIEATGPYGEVIGKVAVPATDQVGVVTIPNFEAPAEYDVSGIVTNGQGDPTVFDVEVLDASGTVLTQTDVLADGSFNLPFVPPASNLQLVVVGPSGETSSATALNTSAGNVSGVQLIAPSKLANTGFEASSLVLNASLLLFLGGAILLIARRRTTN
jgi:hypothetical protein